LVTGVVEEWSRGRCYIMSPGICSGVVSKCVVGEAAIVVITVVEEGMAATVPAAVGGVFA